MDPIYYSRVAMSGWVYVAVIILSLIETSSHYWTDLICMLRTSNSTLPVAVLGAIVGIGGPPAFGFVLERIVSFVLWISHFSMWYYPSVKGFGESVRTQAKGKLDFSHHSSARGALFHAFFYTYGDEKLIDWMRRRRTQLYASFTAAFAIILGLATSKYCFDSDPHIVKVVSLILVLALIASGIRELTMHRSALSAWVDTFGATGIKNFTKQLVADSNKNNEAQRSA